MVYNCSCKIRTTLPVSPISSQSPILMSVLPYHLKAMDHSKHTCTCSTSSWGSSVLLLESSFISAHVRFKVAFTLLSISVMDLYTESVSSGLPAKSPAVASAAWLGELKYQWIPGTCIENVQLQQWHHESDPTIINLHFWMCAVVNLWFLAILSGFGVPQSVKHSVPHRLTMILDKNLWARCSNVNPPQCTVRGFWSCNWIPGNQSLWLMSYMWQGPIEWDKKCINFEISIISLHAISPWQKFLHH